MNVICEQSSSTWDSASAVSAGAEQIWSDGPGDRVGYCYCRFRIGKYFKYIKLF